MPINTPPEHDEDADVIKQKLVQIVAQDFNRFVKTGQAIPDRDIVKRLVDTTFGCPDLAALQITGSVQNVVEFNQLMEEEGALAQTSGHVLRVFTGYRFLPEFRLLVLDVERSGMTGMVQTRVRNIMRLGVKDEATLPVHEVEVAELIKAIRAV